MTSELSDALNPYASQARQRQQQQQHILQSQIQHQNHNFYCHSAEYSPQNQYQYQPVVQPVQQHVPHVSELEMAITEPVVAISQAEHVVAPTRPLHHQNQHQQLQPQDPNAQVLTDLMHMLLATQHAQEEERQRRIAWEEEQEAKYSQRQADMEVKMVQMLDELKALRSTVNTRNEPLPCSNTDDNDDALADGNDLADDNHVLGLVLEPSLGSTSRSSGLVSPPTTVFSPALSQLSTGTTTSIHQHHHYHPVTPTSPITHPAFPHPQAQPSPHPMFLQGSSTSTLANPIPEPNFASGSALSQANAPYLANTSTFQLSLAHAQYTISPEREPEPELETLDESSDRQRSKSPKPKAQTGKRKKKNQREGDEKTGKGRDKGNDKKKKTKKITYIPVSPENDDEEDDNDESSGRSSSDSLSSVEKRPRKRRNHHDTRCYTIHHAMRTHILQMMGLESDKELPDSYVESETPNPSTDPSNPAHRPIRFIWNKTTKQSLHNALMKKLVISDLKDHRRSATYKHVAASEFTKKLMDAAFEQCFVTLRQKFKTQRDDNVALKAKAREEGKARKARHLSRRRIKLENRSEARIKLPSFEHVIFDGALHQDCMSSEDSEIETDTQTGESLSVFRTRGYAWRSKRLLRFYDILDEEVENPDTKPTSTLKRRRGMGKRERRTGPVREAFSLPPEGVSSWMLSKRWYRESKVKYPDFEALMSKLIVSVRENADAGTALSEGSSTWLRFRELGDESEDGEENGRVGVTSVPEVARPSTTHQDSFRVHLHSADMSLAPQQPYGTSSGIFMNYTL